MTTGTKVFLALFALIVGTLVVYYGVIMPDNATVGGNERQAAGSGGEAKPNQPDDAPREPEVNRQSPSEVQPLADRGAAPPRDPAPISQPVVNPPVNAASAAGGLLSEGVREAGGDPAPRTGAVDIDGLKVTPGGTTPSDQPSGLLPLVGLNDGDLRTDAADAAKGDVEPARQSPGSVDPASQPEQPKATPASVEPTVKPEANPATPTSVPPPPARVEYLIAEGDTFTSIAEEWFGDENKWSLIAKENPTVDPQKLKIGQRIFLPPKETAITAAKPEPVLQDGESIHVVQSGDTLIAIARDHFGEDGKWEEIYALNKSLIGADPAALKVGMKLRLPKKPA